MLNNWVIINKSKGNLAFMFANLFTFVNNCDIFNMNYNKELVNL